MWPFWGSSPNSPSTQFHVRKPCRVVVIEFNFITFIIQYLPVSFRLLLLLLEIFALLLCAGE